MSEARQLGVINGTVTVNDRVDGTDTRILSLHGIGGQQRRAAFEQRNSRCRRQDSGCLRAAGCCVSPRRSCSGTDRPGVRSGRLLRHVWPYGVAETNYTLSVTTTLATSSGLDVSTVSPITDYDGHLGADYMETAGAVALSPVNGRVVRDYSRWTDTAQWLLPLKWLYRNIDSFATKQAVGHGRTA